jgi:uncharacterized protein YbaR (Trm112 family)
MISDKLLNILACPETKQPIRLADNEILSKINNLIATKSIKNRKGELVEQQIDSLLVREDGKFGYVVRDDIPIMLIDEAIGLN